MRTSRTRTALLKALAVSAVATLALAGCAGDADSGTTDGAEAAPSALDASILGVSDETAAAMDELYQAALEAGGDLVLYGTNHANMQHLYDEFEATFPGMTVETHQQKDPTAILEAEKASGNYVADILQNPSGLKYIEQGVITAYEPPAFSALGDLAPELLANLHDPEFMYTTPQFTPFGVGINTDLIDPKDAPKSWADFAKPEWAGKIVLHDPTVPGGGQAILERLLQSGTVDEAWLAKIAENASLKGDYAGSVTSLVQGEFPVLLPGAGSDLENKKVDGAPVQFMFMEEDNIGLADKWMMLEGAPIEAGKLFLNFLYTQVGQQAIADTSNLPIRDDATSPHGWPSLTAAKLAVIPSEAELQERHEVAVAVLTDTFRK